MKNRRSALSKTEWTIMNLCWEQGKATARQIHEASLERRRRDYRTVKTQLDRIAAKGYLEIEKLGPLCLYSPAVPRREALAEAIREFVDVVLDRTMSPLFVHLAESRELSEDEIEKMRTLVERHAKASPGEAARRDPKQLGDAPGEDEP